MIKKYQLLAVVLPCVVLYAGSGCSRARVESMTKLNEGVQAAQQKRFMDAVAALERAGAIDGTNDQAFWNLALVHMEMRKYERAHDDLNKAIAINPGSAGYQEKLGTVLSVLKEWEGARRALEEAIKLDPNLFKADLKFGQVLERLDDQQNALKYYTDAIKKAPRFLEAYIALGRLYADLGYLDQATQVFQEAFKVALPGTDEGANVHHMLGTVYQQQGKQEDAIREFRAALEMVPGMREALFSLGWAYFMKGDKEEGSRYLKKFLEVAGSDTPSHYVSAAQRKLADLNRVYGK